MKIDIEYKTEKEHIKIVASGIFCFCIYNIHFSNIHDFIRQKIRCGKSFDRMRISEYHPPEYIGDKKNERKTNNQKGRR